MKLSGGRGRWDGKGFKKSTENFLDSGCQKLLASPGRPLGKERRRKTQEERKDSNPKTATAGSFSYFRSKSFVKAYPKERSILKQQLDY